jgi:hypothetical protein
MSRKPRDVRDPAALEATVRKLAGDFPEYVVVEPPRRVTLPDGTVVLASRAVAQPSGPPPGTGWTVERVAAVVAHWDGEWPPTQEAVAGFEGLPGPRRLRRLGWPAILRRAAELRGTGSG